MWLHGLAEGKINVLWLLGRLKTQWLLWWIQGQTENHQSYIDWMRTTKMAFVATRISLGHKLRRAGYMGRLRTARVLWWLQRLAKDQHSGLCGHWSRPLGHKDFDCYRGRLRTTMVLWRLHGLAEDDEYVFCGHWKRLRTQRL